MMVSIHWNLLFQGAPIFRWTMFVLGGCMDKGSPIPLLRGTSPVLQALKKTPHTSRVLDWNNRIITGKLGNVPSSETRWFEQMKNLNVSFHFLKSYESIRTLKDQHCYPLPFLKRSTIRSIFFFFKFWGSRWTFPIFFQPQSTSKNPIARVSGSFESPGSQVNLSIVQVNLFWSAFESWNPQYDCWWFRNPAPAEAL